MTTHKDLNVWKKSMNLVILTYRLTGQFPKEELFGLSSQMRRAAVSIPSNIAEGHGRNSDKELIRFLFISLGSASELETQILLSNKLDFLNEEGFNQLNELNNEVIRMLVALIRSKNNGQLVNLNTDNSNIVTE
ncbi:MAG: four helix bundle protein [Paludibacter sp.]|jgi:four helix bundle protein|nr:four helix bundle protein [Paludibacter sp.]MBP7612319.1 four helix bundle protein [Paludibacter sp.]